MFPLKKQAFHPIAKATLHGDQREAVYVECDPAIWAVTDLKLDQLQAVLEARNIRTGGGSVDTDTVRVGVYPTGEFGMASEIASVVVGQSAIGTPVTLSDVGFTVRLILDATRRQMDEAAKQFAQELDDAGRQAVGLVYYAGHAVSYGGRNWLLPVDANITQGSDIEYESISSGWKLVVSGLSRNLSKTLSSPTCAEERANRHTG